MRAAVELGHTLGLHVVAEGIESREMLDLVAGLGCDIGQGYFISTPKPADKLAFRPPEASLRSSAATNGSSRRRGSRGQRLERSREHHRA